jgi:hypothetical protein
MSEHATFGVPEWTLGDRLGKALDFAEINVGEMADELECSRNTVSNYTNDHVKVPGSVLKVWALRTGVPLEWLKTGVEPPPKGPVGLGVDGQPEADGADDGGQPSRAYVALAA